MHGTIDFPMCLTTQPSCRTCNGVDVDGMEPSTFRCAGPNSQAELQDMQKLDVDGIEPSTSRCRVAVDAAVV